MPAREFDYVSDKTTPLKGVDKSTLLNLLWGDRVEVLEDGDPWVKVRARGRDTVGWVKKTALGGEPLLEVYFIDVGQGDGILIKTPGKKHLMVDGGNLRKAQNPRKNAADFVDWKFFHDYGEDKIELEAVIASHCDVDHYGGLTDLLAVDKNDELDCKEVRVETIYHAGLGYWSTGDGEKTLGPTEPKDGKRFFRQLVGNREEVEAALQPDAEPALAGEWAKFMQAAADTLNAGGDPAAIERLSDRTEHLNGFGPGVDGEVAIKVLGPLEFEVEVGGKTLHARQEYDGEAGISTNGNSVLLRLDYNGCRILLTGDLNTESQEALLEFYEGKAGELACDVAKACHHGSEDVSIPFLQALEPAATVISSGDNEGHDHPRPKVISASALTGYRHPEDGKTLESPLIFSTELSRSVKLGPPVELVYGLVNVRTDGKEILFATRDEHTRRWRTDKVDSRF
ncbi:MAG TPA: MBL fold metallo-hydrolase [Solirubrobacterales bacterium]|nr:MBL fold metallo-hydrolase [Solirubrobacterales bacterium]